VVKGVGLVLEVCGAVEFQVLSDREQCFQQDGTAATKGGIWDTIRPCRGVASELEGLCDILSPDFPVAGVGPVRFTGWPTLLRLVDPPCHGIDVGRATGEDRPPVLCQCSCHAACVRIGRAIRAANRRQGGRRLDVYSREQPFRLISSGPRGSRHSLPLVPPTLPLEPGVWPRCECGL
jgi:hypothetical protein